MTLQKHFLDIYALKYMLPYLVLMIKNSFFFFLFLINFVKYLLDFKPFSTSILALALLEIDQKLSCHQAGDKPGDKQYCFG